MTILVKCYQVEPKDHGSYFGHYNTNYRIHIGWLLAQLLGLATMQWKVTDMGCFWDDVHDEFIWKEFLSVLNIVSD